MKHGLTFACIGGDLRLCRVVLQLAGDGHNVRTFGLAITNTPKHTGIHPYPDLASCIRGADVVILPLPYNNAPESINCTLADVTIPTRDVLEAMEPKQLLLAGRSDSYLTSLAQLHGIRCVDYLEREELTVLNTIPTVEGALRIAMEETPYTLHGSECLVLGYGRIGKYLSHSLQALGAKTTVAARKHSDLAWIKAYHMNGIYIKDLQEHIGQYQIIFNTVPAKLLDFPLLSSLRKDCLIIDLASRPGGVDFETAQKLGKKVIWALSLPGKVAPETAGDIMKNTIVHILEELEV